MARLHVRSWQTAYRGLIPDSYLDAMQPEDRAQYYGFDGRAPDGPTTLLAVEAEEIRGFATVGPSRDADRPDAGELRALYVDPLGWDRGIGRALIAAARDELLRRGFTDATLWVLAGNARAKRFYRLDGWTPDGARRPEQIGTATVEEIRYERALTRAGAHRQTDGQGNQRGHRTA